MTEASEIFQAHLMGCLFLLTVAGVAAVLCWKLPRVALTFLIAWACFEAFLFYMEHFSGPMVLFSNDGPVAGLMAEHNDFYLGSFGRHCVRAFLALLFAMLVMEPKTSHD